MSDRAAWDALVAALGELELRKRRVAFFLGSDEHIPHEARVAFVPRHLTRLREALDRLGIELDLFVHRGAGQRAAGRQRAARQRAGGRRGAGFADADYAAAGATLVGPDDFSGLPSLDVVHALKEPCDYEADLPGPFLRIGAAHLASRPSGICRLLARRSFAGLFDGGTIGSCAFVATGGDRTPIVGCMSRFAGQVAARKVVEALAGGEHDRGKVVVVGGGIAGMSAVRVLRPVAAKLVVVERLAEARNRVTDTLRRLGYESYEVVPTLTDDAIRDAIGIVFAHRSGAKAAEKVCTVEQIHLMKPGAAIADIAIDQGGSIAHAGYDEADDAATARRKYQALLADYSYYAETNMPREEPREASEVHGDASLPYVLTLLVLAARHGDACEAIADLVTLTPRICHTAADADGLSLVDSYRHDLRNGLQLAFCEGAVDILDEDIRRDGPLLAWIESCCDTRP